jgi:hypothetical protein
VWASLQETSRQIRELAESQKETERVLKETRQIIKETGQIIKENAEEQRKAARDFDRRLGEYINLFGEVTEYEMAPNLREKFIELGLEFPRANRNVVIKDKGNNTILEIDVMLENGDKAILVEIKTKLTIERVNNHISRLEKMRKHAGLNGDKRAFLGAVAAVVVTGEERNYALNQGLYLVEPAGKSLNITAPNGKPKEW